MKDKKPKEEFDHLIPDMRIWLGSGGLNFFRNIKEEYGVLNAVWMEGGIPHPVHFREGMQVRNKLRELTQGTWTSHEYDNTWVDVIEECIKIDWDLNDCS
jgi:hypothetical protein